MKIKEWIALFIQQEHNAAHTYELIGQKSIAERAEIAEVLRQEELGHIKELELLSQSLEDATVPWNEELERSVKQVKEQILSKKELKIQDQKTLIIYALQNEKLTIAQYEKFYDALDSNSKTAKLFKQLIEREQEHMFTILRILHQLK